MILTIGLGVSFFITSCISIIFYKKSRQMEINYAQLDKDYAVLVSRYETLCGRFDTQISEYQELNTKYQQLDKDYTQNKARSEGMRTALEDKIAYLEKIKEELTLKFKNISQEIIKSQHESFSTEQKNTLNQVLTPFSEQLKAFKAEVTTAREESIKHKSGFDEQLKNLLNLNQNLSKEAQNLTDALKGGKKTQGNWGECRLERVLEISGMQKGQDYETQSSYTDENNKQYRPDVVIHLPENRDIIVDSKVSLNAYMDAVNTQNEAERQISLKQNVANIKKHIDELSAKKYQTLIADRSLNYVIMFIPVESAYIAALDTDEFIYDYAYRKNIILATPLSLLPTLRTIQNLWQISNQNQNVLQIAEHGGKIYDKLAAFIEDMKAVERGINQSQKAYINAMTKICGQGGAISQAEKIKKLGAKTNKSINLPLTDSPILLEETKDKENLSA